MMESEFTIVAYKDLDTLALAVDNFMFQVPTTERRITLKVSKKEEAAFRADIRNILEYQLDSIVAVWPDPYQLELTNKILMKDPLVKLTEIYLPNIGNVKIERK